MLCHGNIYHNFLACTCLSSTHTAARHKHTLVRIMSYYCCHVVAAQQACTATGVITSQCPAAVSPWQPPRSSLRAVPTDSPRLWELREPFVSQSCPGEKTPHNPRGPSAEHLCRERSCSLWGHPLDLHCWSYQGGTGLAEMPNWLLLSLPGPSASRAVTVVTREGNQAELSPATRETCTNLTAN